MRGKKRLTREMRKRQILLRMGSVITLGVVCIFTGVMLLGRGREEKADPKYIPPVTEQEEIVAVNREVVQQEKTVVKESWSYQARMTDKTGTLADSVVSETGILIHVGSGEILAAKGPFQRISPASMTKILTVLVAAEQLKEADYANSFVMTQEIKDYSYLHDCSDTGFEVGEVIPVKDLFYGTIMPSGADAALGLATYVAGSPEAFVELMNEKLKEIGLSETSHMTNCIGLYDEDHYSTVYDIAVMLKAATDNPWCKEVLSEHIYTTGVTAEHPEGITISNLFLRRIEDRDTHGLVLCAKTGYVNQSGSCAASLALDDSREEYICVTAGSSSSWQCIADQVDIYTEYLPE